MFNLPAGYREAEDTIVGKFFTDMLAFTRQRYPELADEYVAVLFRIWRRMMPAPWKQDLQAQRYFEFGEKGVQDGLWDEYLTCLLSPQAYFSSLEPSEYFSSYLSYEEIEEWFSMAAVKTNAVPKRVCATRR